MSPVKESKNKVRLPAEWEKHSGTILCWPANPEDWPGKFVPIHWVYTEIVKNILAGETVYLIVQNKKHKQTVERMLEKAHALSDDIVFIVKETDRSWMRDSAPAFRRNGKETEAVHFLFNGWAKYPNYKKDKLIPATVTKTTGHTLITAMYNNRQVVLEGGAIDCNGAGVMLTTEECLLDPVKQVRNPGFTKTDYANVFKEYLGIKEIIWLKNGIAGDDTHGHIDDLCRFVNKNTVLLAVEENSADDNYTSTQENYELLKGYNSKSAGNITVIKLPMPAPVVFEDMRLPASYANFYVTNNAVLVPTFNDPNDRKALQIIADCFPERKVTGIHATDLVWGLGTLHCLAHEVYV